MSNGGRGDFASRRVVSVRAYGSHAQVAYVSTPDDWRPALWTKPFPSSHSPQGLDCATPVTAKEKLPMSGFKLISTQTSKSSTAQDTWVQLGHRPLQCRVCCYSGRLHSARTPGTLHRRSGHAVIGTRASVFTVNDAHQCLRWIPLSFEHKAKQTAPNSQPVLHP
jgi:hypothetical protein